METVKGIFDTHAHYNDEKFKDNFDEIISYIHSNGVEFVCNVGANLKESEESIEIAKKYDFIYCSVGIHPFYAEKIKENWQEDLIKLSKYEKVVAIGEAGLDYSEKEFSKSKQFDLFEKQLEIAQKLNLPIIIHSRDAAEDTLAIVKNFPKVKGVVHCFSGDDVLAEKYINMGYKIGFTGVITFKNAKKTIKAAQIAPIGSIVVETDCPYMAPEPLRGTVSNSSMIKYIIQKIADVKNLEYEEVLKQTRKNGLDLYKIKI